MCFFCSSPACQLDLFDSVMEGDRLDALSAGGPPGGDEDIDPTAMPLASISEEEKTGDGPLVEYRPDPPAVASIRVALDKLEEEEAKHMLMVVAEKLERMATADCDVKHWKKIW